ncbi:MAG: cyclic nucleotide-binding domain-containing protein [Desulfobacterales bacterium]
MKEKTGKKAIVSRIIDGSVTINTVAEIKNLLKAFPNDPWIHRFFADILKRDKSFYAAADAYGTAAGLFIKNDMTLQAIVSKFLEWRILKPSVREALAFYSSLRERKSDNTRVRNFFIKMTYPEMMAFMNILELRHFPAGNTLKRFGEEEDDLYFIVSGALEETIYHRIQKGGKLQKKSTNNLAENDFFGEIYPFDEEKVSPSTVETITRVEFAKCSKSGLMAVCKKYPNIKLIISDLYEGRSASDQKHFSGVLRETVRHRLPTQVNVKIYSEEPDKAPLNLNGFTENISLGGACIILGSNYKTGYFGTLAGKKVQIQIYLAIAFVSLSILGTVVWSTGVSLEGKRAAAVGIQFAGMTDADRRLLQSFNYGSEKEQDMIWSLWDSMMEKQHFYG